ncbi:cysteine methyltransferase [Pseudoalteromonas citrea]|uniref:Methylated-DNA--protein-cysteine methyltransferase n=2 Tax=Pseudoalteromonas citrea TaxID=43655 RepID=A0A5S3XL67_9GAMM|nr:methylated-DNA--[protein]-cysteine S-methyltransferase [Pseudoalteromonas citrea]TMP40813.1 cysteine methyltransferase [Pseudoalteromonas citrea]TMP54128.1 cysteine methyltransferase [Pseudoalteromonas citrea]
MFVDYLNSPLGTIECVSSEKGLRHVIFCGEQVNAANPNKITHMCIKQLAEYFQGSRNTFTIPLDPVGTDFQQQVWQSLNNIPFGETRSYLDIAQQVGRPKGSQAVGGANGRNPISIIVPCHRVIASSGKLTGYAGGIERKLWLLEHEGIYVKASNETKQLDIKNVLHTRQSKTQYLF